MSRCGARTCLWLGNSGLGHRPPSLFLARLPRFLPPAAGHGAAVQRFGQGAGLGKGGVIHLAAQVAHVVAVVGKGCSCPTLRRQAGHQALVFALVQQGFLLQGGLQGLQRAGALAARALLVRQFQPQPLLQPLQPLALRLHPGGFYLRQVFAAGRL